MTLAKQIGSRVVCAVSRVERARLCRSRGADEIVIYDGAIETLEARKRYS